MSKGEKSKEFKEWYNSRPQVIKNLVDKYPDQWYRIKKGAPYGVSCPGTLVAIYSYTESGNINVVVCAKDKLPEAIQHEKDLCAKHGTDYNSIKGKDTLVLIDPIWLEPIYKD